MLAVVCAVTLLCACASSSMPPPVAGLVMSRVAGAPFTHVVYRNAALMRTPAATRVHVYIDGDGRPWRGDAVRADPSPRGTLVLQMLRADPEPALYLGRPCHFTRAADAACTPNDYTFARYGERVLGSLLRALDASVPAGAELVLVGHSGGGVLAMLLAARIDARRVKGVVTLAANLDVAAWARGHGYTPLFESLDPAREPPLPRTLRQLHLVGGHDRAVPPAVTRAGLAGQPWAEVRELAQFDHACCWLRVWPETLREVRAW